jgi:hypothetical protein
MAGHDEDKFASESFELTLSIATQTQTIVPLGVPDIGNRAENAFLTFNYTLSDTAVDSLLFEVIDHNGDVLYRYLPGPDYTLPGVHQIVWDGFDNNEIYDSSRFNKQNLQAKITAFKAGKAKIFTLSFTAQYKVVQWLDIKIERRAKKITATLRTNFQDGAGHKGKLALQKRTKSFEELLALAIEGLQYHWGRNEQHPAGKNIILNGEAYEFFMNVINTDKRAVKSPKIVYQTNARSRRSRNWELSRILFYNIGHLQHAGKWYYKAPDKANSDFKLIAAHEIGHEILLAYGGHLYSKTHKGSSTLLTQAALGNFLYPEYGEIDLMLYYADNQQHPCPPDYISRSVASEEDTLGLIWLSKLQITFNIYSSPLL